MGETTGIQWTSRTWNPVRGCTRVSEGCRNCYAEAMAARNLPGMRSPTTGEPFATRTKAGPRWTGRVELIPEKLREPLSWRKPCRVFVNSMSDLFHEALDFKDIARVMDVIEAAQRHTFQVLTKRAARMSEFFDYTTGALGLKPPPNLWLGVSVEDQATADERIPLLLQTPAAVRFVSYEPALGPVDFSLWLGPVHPHAVLDWIIVGGESGPGARRFDASWARSTAAQCRAAGVACFVKQMGAWVKGDADGFRVDRWLCSDVLQGDYVFVPGATNRARRPLTAVAFGLSDRKGGDPSAWPVDLRVREFPA